MARSRKREKNDSPDAGMLRLKVLVDPTEDTPSYYANYVEANVAPHELALSFVRVPTKLSVASTEEVQTSGTLKLEPSVQVIFAPTLLPLLIRALTQIKETYESTFGPIRSEDHG